MIVEGRSLQYSFALHALAVLVALVGLPALLPSHPDPTPLVMSVEVLPISDTTNVKPEDKPLQKAHHAPPLKMPKPLPPAAKEPPKPSPAPAPKPPTPEPEKHFDPMEGAEPAPKPPEKKEDPKPQEAPKTPEKKEAPKPAPKSDDFSALLNKLNQENAPPTPAKDAKDKTTTEENKTKSDAPYDASKPLSISERDAIRSQFIPCWRPATGAKDAASLIARVKVELQQDGTVKSAVLASDQQSRYNSDGFFRAAADAAIRAVYKCSPLKNLPPEKYGTWSSMEITFDPKDMVQ